MLSGLIHTLYENILNIMMANLYSVSTLGYYSNALKIRDGAAQTLSDSIQKVSFPVLSQIQSDKDAMHQNSSKILRLSIVLIFPILITHEKTPCKKGIYFIHRNRKKKAHPNRHAQQSTASCA